MQKTEERVSEIDELKREIAELKRNQSLYFQREMKQTICLNKQNPKFQKEFPME